MLGRSILSFVLVVGAVVSTAVDWNTSHLFNPTWHPHARFHDALFLLIIDAMSPIALWLLWRRSKEPEIGLKVAALLSAAIWTPFFYITPLIPGTSLLAAEDVPVLRVAGMSFPPESHRCRCAALADGHRLLAGPRCRGRCVKAPRGPPPVDALFPRERSPDSQL
jgi:hypothetical protein